MKSGEKVAVKVQHEWLQEESSIDLLVVEMLSKIGKKMFKDFDYDWLINDMKHNVPEELDFRIEARNAIKTKELFKDDHHVKVPYIYNELSTVKIAYPVKDINDGVC